MPNPYMLNKKQIVTLLLSHLVGLKVSFQWQCCKYFVWYIFMYNFNFINLFTSLYIPDSICFQCNNVVDFRTLNTVISRIIWGIDGAWTVIFELFMLKLNICFRWCKTLWTNNFCSGNTIVRSLFCSRVS